MQEVKFVNEKAGQLVSLFNQFLLTGENHNALVELTWDILLDWQRLDTSEEKNLTTKERVFWHILFELQYWDKDFLLHSKKIRSELYNCALYLEREKQIPVNCVGIRPEKSPIEAENESHLEAEVA